MSRTIPPEDITEGVSTLQKIRSFLIRNLRRTTIKLLLALKWIKTSWQDQETRNIIQAVANVATAFSVVVALITIAWTINESRSREAQEQIKNVQRPFVYSIIERLNSVSDDELFDVYRTEGSKRLPKHVLTPEELNRVVLSLMEARVIVMDEQRKYHPSITSAIQDQIYNSMYKQTKTQHSAAGLRARILSILDDEPGKYTTKTLFDRLKTDGAVPAANTDHGEEFDLIVNIVADLRAQNLVFKYASGLLSSTHNE